MPEGDALTLGEIQRRFTESLKVIEALKVQLGDLAAAELATTSAGEQLGTASQAVMSSAQLLAKFAETAGTAIAAFETAMAIAGEIVQQTTLVDLEASVASLTELVDRSSTSHTEKFLSLDGEVTVLADKVNTSSDAIAEQLRALEAKVDAMLGSMKDEASRANQRAESAEIALNRIPAKYRTKFAN